jgi:hypothetical protein
VRWRCSRQTTPTRSCLFSSTWTNTSMSASRIASQLGPRLTRPQTCNVSRYSTLFKEGYLLPTAAAIWYVACDAAPVPGYELRYLLSCMCKCLIGTLFSRIQVGPEQPSAGIPHVHAGCVFHQPLAAEAGQSTAVAHTGAAERRLRPRPCRVHGYVTAHADVLPVFARKKTSASPHCRKLFRHDSVWNRRVEWGGCEARGWGAKRAHAGGGRR